MKLWRDKDWIWLQNDSGMSGCFHIDYLPWMNVVIPKLVSREIERDEFILPDDEEPDPSTTN